MSNKNVLSIKDLHVYYGLSHVLQGISIDIPAHGILSLVGRNGMGKSTLCKSIVGIKSIASGSIHIEGKKASGLDTHKIAGLGVGYVPQGRRIWPSLSVHEHLKLAYKKDGLWDIERIYQVFPILAERKNNGGSKLSGGEQQMLAISRALLGNPRLLIMDEPTEGLAPVIVKQVENLLIDLVKNENIGILLIEQNLGVAMSVSKKIAIMVNGRIETIMNTKDLEANRELQKNLLGVGSNKEKDTKEQTFTYELQGITQPINKWQQATKYKDIGLQKATDASLPLAKEMNGQIYVVGTFDTKENELIFVQNIIQKKGLHVCTIDLSTSDFVSTADISPKEVANAHPNGSSEVFSNDRGKSINAMSVAFIEYINNLDDIAGIIGLGGSGGTALITPAMQTLDIGIPKFMISTVASGDVSNYVGPCDICMMYSVTDVSGLNQISTKVLSNGANAIMGMATGEKQDNVTTKKAIAFSMFGVTTPCVQSLTSKLENNYDCLVFHATGTGGKSMEKLVDSGLIDVLLDISTTEICDLITGGVMSAGKERLDSIIRTKIPYIGSCGALDMANFGAISSVPERYKKRKLYVHNQEVTLMRINELESKKVGEFIANKLNLCEGEVRFLIPELGVSALDIKGGNFDDKKARETLFTAIEKNTNITSKRQIIRVNAHINDKVFSDELLKHFNEIKH